MHLRTKEDAPALREGGVSWMHHIAMYEVTTTWHDHDRFYLNWSIQFTKIGKMEVHYNGGIYNIVVPM